MRLNHEFSEFVSLANQRDVKYLVVGGYALAAHGHPRMTKDLDVWILADPGNVSNLLVALEDFGFGSLGPTAGDFAEQGTVIQLGYPPNRIDISVGISGVEFEECWDRRVTLELDDVAVPFIGREDLIANKRASGRLQDLADIEYLEGGSN